MPDTKEVKSGAVTIQIKGFNPFLVMPDKFDPTHPPTITFCGTCNWLGESGELLRNKARDVLLLWAKSNRIMHYEVQIHPDIHGIQYADWHQPLERQARELARLRVYEVSELTPGSVTFAELMQDAALGRKGIVWFRSGAAQYVNPSLGSRGELKMNTALRDVMGLHYQNYMQLWGSINNLRETVLAFLKTIPTSKLQIIEGDDPEPVIVAIKDALDLT